MSCSIDHKGSMVEFTISKEIITNLYPLLYKDKEHAGKIHLDTNKRSAFGKSTLVEGEESSVSAPHAMINYHSHPLHMYLIEKTSHGFASSEDYIMVLLGAIKGNLTHLIPAVESTYIIQTNPCIVENIIHLDKIIDEDLIKKSKLYPLIQKHSLKIVDFMRGLILTTIEIYFRTLHAFRTYEFNKKHPVKIIDFLKFTNAFKLSNIFSEKAIKGCSKKLKCDNVYTFESKLMRSNFKKYVSDYESDTKVYSANNKGSAYFTDILMVDAIKLGALELIKDLKFVNTCKYPKKIWSEKWFKVSALPNYVLVNGKKVLYDNLNTEEKWSFINEVSSKKLTNVIFLSDLVKPTFYFFKMFGSCDHKDIQNNLAKRPQKSSKKRSLKKYKFSSNKISASDTINDPIVLIGSKNCSWCVKMSEKLKQMSRNGYNVDIRCLDIDISKAIDLAKQYSGLEIKTIPAVFHKKVLIDHNKL